MCPSSTPNTKLRQQKRRQRRQLSTGEQHQHSRLLSRQLLRTTEVRNAGRIAAYLASDGEIDPTVFLDTAWQRGQQIYLPVLSPLRGNRLYFAPWWPHCPLRPNRFGIAEPDCNPAHWLRAQQLDVILLPLVAFDEHGNRLGMGGGFYDRTLAFLHHRQHRHKPLLVGLAHECQASDAIITQNWDIPLDAIATEQRFMRFGGHGR